MPQTKRITWYKTLIFFIEFSLLILSLGKSGYYKIKNVDISLYPLARYWTTQIAGYKTMPTLKKQREHQPLFLTILKVSNFRE